MKTQVIVPAAGIGARFGGDVPKTFVELNGCPIIAYCLKTFECSPSVTSVIVVGEANTLEDLRGLIEGLNLKKIKAVVAGGATRRASIENGLKVLDADTDLVMIHDGARPLVTVDIVERAIADAKISGANVMAVPVTSTIKTVNASKIIDQTLDRSTLWDIQTPQTFKKGILLDAYARRGDFEPTDCASLLERAGYPVRVVEGSRSNIKITTREDLILAEILLGKK